MVRWLSRFLTAAFVLAASIPAFSQQTTPPVDDFVKSHYTKYEFRIPMRDGKRLFTAVYVPKTGAFPSDAGPYPFLMDRTPYSVGAVWRRQISRASGAFG